MSVLNNNFEDPIEILFDISVVPVSGHTTSMDSWIPGAIHEAFIDAANNHSEWIAKLIYDLKAFDNIGFTAWLHEVVQRVLPNLELSIHGFVLFYYGMPEAPMRMATINIEAMPCGFYNLKIIDKRWGQQYGRIPVPVYDEFLKSCPSETNGYDLLNAILNKSHKS